jgi:Flp pilus assembly pilin Flp
VRRREVDLQATWQYVRVRFDIGGDERGGQERDGDERGASLVEYALLVTLIALVCVAAIQLLGQSSSSKLSQAGGSLTGS